MSKRRKIVYIMLGVLAISIFAMAIASNMPSLATDSGYDTDYDTDSSGGGSGFDILYLIMLIIDYPIIGIPILIILVASIMSSSKKKKVDPMTNIQQIQNYEYDEETKSTLLLAYQIFYDIQTAWMNFDYQMLQFLLTDEMFHMYQNQLDTLQLKGQKNIMSDFEVHNMRIISKTSEDQVQTTVVFLNVSFYDYIVDADNKVVRGSSTTRVNMRYRLTFVANELAQEKCPNCGAPLSKPNICDYCGSHIQALTSNMRLAKKEVIQQTMEGM